MKRFIRDDKGFTLIELLAVIVILAILVMVAIPAVTRYLNAARQGTFADNAKSAISAVRNDVVMNGYGSKDYTLGEINDLLEKKLNTSSFGSAYSENSKISVISSETGSNTGEYTYEYKMCLFDEDGHGFQMTSENDITDKIVKMSGVKDCGS